MFVFVWFVYQEASSGIAPSFGWKKETRQANRARKQNVRNICVKRGRGAGYVLLIFMLFFELFIVLLHF